ncbi:MAG: hypothetical protein ABW292_17785 [Vicinamibacterales bacterium]
MVRLAVQFAALVAAAVTVIPSAASAQNTSEDEYTRYELLDPASASFKIIYDVTAASPGARFYFNPIRPGSEASEESVVDLMTGAPLKFEVVTGAKAREDGFTRADLETSYIKVHLARQVPPNGGGRIRILKTYKDPKSYFTEQDAIVFTRSLGIRRNSVVLPAGYELTGCNVPSQIIEERDGRVMLSFMNTYPGPAALTLRAKRVARAQKPASTSPPPPAPRAAAAPAAQSSEPPLRSVTPPERATQDREIVYFLQQPETHGFRLYHDYTESREGTDRYLNIVRAGSTVSNPSAVVLDTGERLQVETLKGPAITAAKIDIGEAVRPESEVVVIRFPSVKKGESVRLRIEETYTDSNRYGVIGDELVWNRSFGRPRNDVVLPEGWFVTASAIPAVVTQESDGRIRLAFVNPRPDSIDVYVKARRRATPGSH